MIVSCVVYLPVPCEFRDWLLEHAYLDKSGVWRCKQTNTLIKTKAELRRIKTIVDYRTDYNDEWQPIYTDPRLELLDHPFCPSCPHDPLYPDRNIDLLEDNTLVVEIPYCAEIRIAI